MPNVQLPPKESNLFKRILVSGGRPRRRGAPGAARRSVWRGRLRGPARPPHGSLFISEPARPDPPPRPGPAGPPALPAGRRGPPGLSARPLPSPPSAAARLGPAALLPETSRRPPQALRAGARRPGSGPRARCGAPRQRSRPPRCHPAPLAAAAACARRGVRALLSVASMAPRARTPTEAGAVLGWGGARAYTGYGKIRRNPVVAETWHVFDVLTLFGKGYVT